ncbi:MAG: hypothetical protein K0V04_29575 [Deltaproteobacteria bacterium]|nr:hypothetical protein [Deltaproteobacteria bacterium]
MNAVEAADGDDKSQTEADHEVAQIKIEIKLESGRVVKPDDNFVVDWGVSNSLEIQADGSSHQFSLMVERKGDKGKAVDITVGYDRDGEAVVAPYKFEGKTKKREVLRIEGGMAIALTITPQKVKGEAPEEEEVEPEPEKRPPGKKIEISEEENDPLGGLE